MGERENKEEREKARREGREKKGKEKKEERKKERQKRAVAERHSFPVRATHMMCADLCVCSCPGENAEKVGEWRVPR